MNRTASTHTVCGKKLSVALLVALSTVPAMADDFEGFTEPYRKINVAAAEIGIIADILVREGDRVQAGQPLAKLDSEVQQALLAIAKQSMHAKGQLHAAIAELSLRQKRLDKLDALHSEGHARQEEIDRARSEVEVARANVLAAKEELLTRKLEHQRMKIQLQRRTVCAPVAGVISTLHKQVGEFVAPNNPDVLTLVELDSLLANFTVTSPQAEKMSIDQQFTILFPASSLKTTGLVEMIAPLTDAESGTVRIKLRVDNPEGRFRSGERCHISLGE